MNCKAFVLCLVCLFAQLCLTLCDPMDCSPPGSSVPGDSPGNNNGVGCCALLQVFFPTWIEPCFPALQVDSVPAELPDECYGGKPDECYGDK